MKSRDLIFLAIVILVVGGLYYLSTQNKAKVMSASIPEHFTVTGRDDCFKCHAREKFAEWERQHKHPGKWRDERVSCLMCHKTPEASSSMNLHRTEISQFTALLQSN